jgi:hypothetical protein
MAGKQSIGKDLEGSSCGLINIINILDKYEYKILPLHQAAQWV